ncbi:hypothetical protein PSYPI_13356 [Pseudomonas syringae pv. pisi str. 1704B]|uniref:Uncharacterized protein n=1 Tax=Pseudomonas syringae pv. pisi str. 1704B TaxID=629263 RepID=F3G8B9_PSESJ|nr:hypothetical protein PSYPI_13356 [Pseudomonas syringae pv. pisi str. 1704B]
MADLIAVDTGQHDVENDRIEAFRGGQMQPAQAVQRPFYRMPPELEELQQVVVDITMVFNNQNVHCRALLFFYPADRASAANASAGRVPNASGLLTATAWLIGCCNLDRP